MKLRSIVSTMACATLLLLLAGCVSWQWGSSVEAKSAHLPKSSHEVTRAYNDLTDDQLADVISVHLRDFPILWVDQYRASSAEREARLAVLQSLAANLEQVDSHRLHQVYLIITKRGQSSASQDGFLEISSNLPLLTRLLFDVPDRASSDSPSFWYLTDEQRNADSSKEVDYLFPLQNKQGEPRLATRLGGGIGKPLGNDPASEFEYFMARYPRRQVE